MTADTPREEAMSIGFDFARDLADPIVRQRLKLLGHDGAAGDVVMPWFEDESFLDACLRAPVDARRTLLVARDPNVVGGWSMMWAEDVER